MCVGSFRTVNSNASGIVADHANFGSIRILQLRVAELAIQPDPSSLIQQQEFPLP